MDQLPAIIFFAILPLFSLGMPITTLPLDQCHTSCAGNDMCSQGCDLWRGMNLMNGSCESFCKAHYPGTRHNQSMVNCRLGCNYAVNNYIRSIEEIFLKMSEPFLAEGTLTPFGMQLAVEDFPSGLASHMHVQYAVVSENVSQPALLEWTYFQPDIVMNSSKVNITGLLPYTQYKFRIVLMPTMRDLLVGHESLHPIKTEPFGPPSDAPKFTHILATSPNQIYVSWDPPSRPNGRLVIYTLNITSKFSIIGSGNNKTISVPSTATTFERLMPGTQYFISLSASVEGETYHHPDYPGQPFKRPLAGPWVHASVITPFLPGNRRAQGLPPVSLFFATQQRVYHLPDVAHMILDERIDYPFRFDQKNTPTPIDHQNPAAFRDFVYDAHRKLIFMANNAGEILSIDNATQREKVVYKNNAFQISKMSYDWMHQHVYFINFQDLVRCTFALDEPVTCEVVAKLGWHVKKIIIDPINGFVFWLQWKRDGAYTNSYFHRSPLVTGSPDLPLFAKLTEKMLVFNRTVGTFQLTFDPCRIYFPDPLVVRRTGMVDNVMQSMACDGSDVVAGQPVPFRTGGPMYQKMQEGDFIFLENLFYWFDSKKYYAETVDHDYQHYQHSSFQPIGPDRDLIVGMRSANVEAQPLPYPINPPTKIRIHLAGAETMYIAWEAPNLLRWQSPAAWRNWTYNVSVAGRSFGVIGDAMQFRLNNLTSDTVYSVEVQAVGAEKSGLWSSAVSVRTYKRNSTSPKVIVATNSVIAEVNLEEPDSRHIITQGRSLEGVTDVIWAPDFVAVYKSGQHLVILPTVAGAFHQPFRSIVDAVSFTYDWIGRKFYWTTPSKRVIQRASFSHLDKPEVVVEVTAAQVLLDPLRGRMYWCSEYVLETAKLNGQNRERLLLLSPLSNDQISSIAIDAKARLLYVVVQKTNGTDIYTRSLVKTATTDEARMNLLRQLPKTRFGQAPVSVFDDRLMWKDDQGLAVTDLLLPNHTLRYHDTLCSFVMVPRFDEELRELNRTYSDFQVVPAAVNETEVELREDGKDIVISWPASSNCNYGTVQYEVTVTDMHGRELIKKSVVTVPSIVVPNVSNEANLQVTIGPTTEWGSGEVTVRRFGAVRVYPESGQGMTIIIVIVVVAISAVSLMAGLVFYCAHRNREIKRNSRRASPDVEGRNWDAQSPLSDNAIYEIRDLDIASMPKLDRTHIVVIRLLGKGAFGEVCLATLTEDLTADLPGASVVAVKKLHESVGKDTRTDFLKEAHFMSQIHHKNILRFHGVCVDAEPYYIVMEYMDGGDLLKYLRARRPGSPDALAPLTIDDLLMAARDVAEGCAYLQENRMVHRDLAARNCLVTHENGTMVVKIGDFGLAREVYHKRYYRRCRKNGGLLPVRWMAPESLIDGIYTAESDVWSFGVIIWEIMTYGQNPYSSLSNDQVVDVIKNGRNPVDFSGPLMGGGVPVSINNLMIQCWKDNPAHRPSFRSCLEILESLLEPDYNSEPESFVTSHKDVLSCSSPKPPKSESYPNFLRSDCPRPRYVYRSSPDRLDQDSCGSDDSGLAITPSVSTHRKDFEMPLASSAEQEPAVQEPGEDDQGYLPIHPGLNRPPTYLSVLHSGSSVSLNRIARAPQVAPPSSPIPLKSLYVNAQTNKTDGGATVVETYCNAMLI